MPKKKSVKPRAKPKKVVRGRKPKKSLRKLYNEYKKKYDKLQARIEAEGQEMQTMKLPDYRSFKLTFESMKETLKEKGQRPSNDRVVDQLVSKQGYKVSRTSAMARKKFFDEMEVDEEYTVKEIMLGKVEFTKEQWDEIKEQYHELRGPDNNYMSSSEAKSIISENIFGSP